MYDLIIFGADIVSQSTTGRYDIAVQSGRIVSLARPGQLHSAREVWDATDCTLIPGLVDAHVHFRDPAFPHRETFVSGSAAAAAGGVTTVLEMPTSEPSVMNVQILQERALHLAGRSIVDFGLYAGAGPDNFADLQPLADAGAVAFKTFMHAPPPDRVATIGPLCVTDSSNLAEVMAAVAHTGLVHALHCEDDSLLSASERRADEAHGLTFGQRHALARPALAEELAVVSACAIARATKARAHFVHISHPDSVRHIREDRAAGLDASVESCPHYLAFNDEVLRQHGPYAKCNPPLRDESARQGLVRALAAGDIDIVSSDHCPNSPDELAGHATDPHQVPAGLAGIEFMLPTLLTMVARGELTLRDLVMVTSASPARRFDLPGKGDIKVGYDADLVAIDPSARWSFGQRPLHSNGAANARYLADLTFEGAVVRTWVRGRTVFADGRVTGVPGYGTWIQRGRTAS